MSTETEERIPARQREELINAVLAIRHLAELARDNLIEKDDLGALNALDLIRLGILTVRNGVGQWLDRLLCPSCGLGGRNIVAVRQGQIEDPMWSAPIGYTDIGFRCQHCEHEWGFTVGKT